MVDARVWVHSSRPLARHSTHRHLEVRGAKPAHRQHPLAVGNLTLLTHLVLDKQPVTGDVPEELEHLKQLTHLETCTRPRASRPSKTTTTLCRVRLQRSPTNLRHDRRVTTAGSYASSPRARTAPSRPLPPRGFARRTTTMLEDPHRPTRITPPRQCLRRRGGRAIHRWSRAGTASFATVLTEAPAASEGATSRGFGVRPRHTLGRAARRALCRPGPTRMRPGRLPQRA